MLEKTMKYQQLLQDKAVLKDKAECSCSSSGEEEEEEEENNLTY